MELENVCLECGERISEVIAEKEISGEMELNQIEVISLRLLQWERQSMELCNLLRCNHIEI